MYRKTKKRYKSVNLRQMIATIVEVCLQCDYVIRSMQLKFNKGGNH